MRIVGGPHDGINVWIGADKVDIKLPVDEPEDSPICPIAARKQRFTRYTVRKFTYSEDDGMQSPMSFHFLVPEDMSDREAMRILFAPKGGVVP